MPVAPVPGTMTPQHSRLSRLSLHRSALWAVLLCAASPAAAQADPIEIADGICAAEIARAEADRGIPAGLLSSIALTESGRWREENAATIAWPWTVMAEGKGRYFPSRDRAAAELHALAAKGVANMDVGCMQVNMRYHGDGFESPEAALDPARNVRYAADFLIRLKQRHGSWVQAVGHYHSANTTYNRPYMLRVFTYWVDVRKALAGAPPRQAAEAAQTADAGPETQPEPRATADAEGPAQAVEKRRTRFAEWVAGRIGARSPGS